MPVSHSDHKFPLLLIKTTPCFIFNRSVSNQDHRNLKNESKISNSVHKNRILVLQKASIFKGPFYFQLNSHNVEKEVDFHWRACDNIQYPALSTAEGKLHSKPEEWQMELCSRPSAQTAAASQSV